MTSAFRPVPERLVLASGNQGKLVELRALLGHLRCEISPLSDYAPEGPEEPGEAFVENAIIKARHACEVSGLPAVADDSGIMVDHLQGAPGVRSARFAGEPGDDVRNLNRVLELLEAVPDEERGAQFVSVVVYMRHPADPLPVIATGIWAGRLLTAPRGTNGFGYDPIFLPGPEDGGDGTRSSAEMSAAEKNALSHRGQALRALLDLTGWQPG